MVKDFLCPTFYHRQYQTPQRLFIPLQQADLSSGYHNGDILVFSVFFRLLWMFHKTYLLVSHRATFSFHFFLVHLTKFSFRKSLDLKTCLSCCVMPELKLFSQKELMRLETHYLGLNRYLHTCFYIVQTFSCSFLSIEMCFIGFWKTWQFPIMGEELKIDVPIFL